LEKPSSKKKKACEGLLRVSRMIVAVARTLAEDLFSKISPSSPGGAVHGERRPIFGHYLYPGNAVVVSVLCLGVGGRRSRTDSTRLCESRLPQVRQRKHRPIFLRRHLSESGAPFLLSYLNRPKVFGSTSSGHYSYTYNITTGFYPCCSLFFIPSSLFNRSGSRMC
jgi:hypothetical protein